MPTSNDFKASEIGAVIGKVLARPDVLRAMEALSLVGKPAVPALDAALPMHARLDPPTMIRRGAAPALTADRAWLRIADAVGVEVRLNR